MNEKHLGGSSYSLVEVLLRNLPRANGEENTKKVK
jgi:hypothetical protein